MKIERIRQQLKHHEGWVDHAYQDSLGYWTIGYGFLIDKRKGGYIPQEVADYWLEYNIENTRRKLDDMLPWWRRLDDIRQEALINMGYQLGINGLLQFKDMLKAIQNHDWETAYEEALDSRWANQTPNRAEEVALMIRYGED